MKSSLFDILLSLFESAVSTDKKKSKLKTKNSTVAVVKNKPAQAEFIKTQNIKSMRVFNFYEQLKFSDDSLKLLMFLFNSEAIPYDLLELTVDKLLDSKANYVTFEQVKHKILSTLSEELDSEQLAFLDLLFYQKEDGYSLH